MENSGIVLKSVSHVFPSHKPSLFLLMKGINTALFMRHRKKPTTTARDLGVNRETRRCGKTNGAGIPCDKKLHICLH